MNGRRRRFCSKGGGSFHLPQKTQKTVGVIGEPQIQRVFWICTDFTCRKRFTRWWISCANTRTVSYGHSFLELYLNVGLVFRTRKRNQDYHWTRSTLDERTKNQAGCNELFASEGMEVSGGVLADPCMAVSPWAPGKRERTG